MEQFIVSARKYRPNTFESLIGQENIATTLKNSILRGQLAHSYLFCGPRGVGKTTTARIFAKSINCLNPGSDMEPCGLCESCLSFTEGRSYCIHELDAASNNSVDDIRNLTDMVRVPPQIGKYSVYIIDEVHMLSTAAFNAFLKTLEEPPAHAIFILATTEKHKILPTILSRCQTYDFNRISIPDIVKNLESIAEKEGVNIENAALHILAQKADGAMRDALTLFDQTVAFCGKEIKYEEVISNLNVLDYEYYFKLIEHLQASDYTSSLLLFDEILSKGFNALHFISGVSSHLRDLLVCKNNASQTLLSLPPTLTAKYRKEAENCSLNFIYEALSITTACEAAYKQSGNQRLLIEFALLKLSFIGKSLETPSVQVSTQVPIQAPAQVQVPAQAPVQEPIQSQAPTQVSGEAPVQAPIQTPVQAPAQAQIPTPPPPQNEAPAPSPALQGKQKNVGTFSLKEMLKSATESSETIKTTTVVTKEEPFDLSALTSVWNRLAEQEKEKNRPGIATALRQYTPEIKEDGTSVLFFVSNSAQKEWIEKNCLVRITAYVKAELNNDNITIDVEVVPADEDNSKKFLSASEKAQFMINSNEELKELQKDLELDF